MKKEDFLFDDFCKWFNAKVLENSLLISQVVSRFFISDFQYFRNTDVDDSCV